MEIPVFVPTGLVKDGMIYDSVYTETINAYAYSDICNNIIMCGIKILGNNLTPTYLMVILYLLLETVFLSPEKLVDS